MSDKTFQATKEDVRDLQARESGSRRDGTIDPASEAATLQSIVDKADKSKAEIIEERKANLPLPEQPPVASDFNSANQRTVNVGSGGVSDTFSHGNDALRGPTTGGSAVREDPVANKSSVQGQGVGREAVEGLGGLPNDAVARGKKDSSSLEDTTNKDYGYPQKSDPADTSKLP